jgi:hypothetical protein
MAESFKQRLWHRGAWLCPLLAMALATATLMVFGVQLWSALLVSLLLICPALLVWGLVVLSRSEKHEEHSHGPDSRS